MGRPKRRSPAHENYENDLECSPRIRPGPAASGSALYTSLQPPAAAIGDGGLMKGCTTESKGAPKRRTLKEWAPRPRVNAEEEEMSASVADGEKPAAAKYRMPKDHVKWILAQKPLAPPPRYAALKQSHPDLTPRPGEEVNEERRRLFVVAKAFFEMEERFPSLQEWVREEMKAKGYVEVDEEWVKDREELNEMIDREWPKIQAKIDAIVLKQGGLCDEADENDSEEDDDYY